MKTITVMFDLLNRKMWSHFYCRLLPDMPTEDRRDLPIIHYLHHPFEDGDIARSPWFLVEHASDPTTQRVPGPRSVRIRTRLNQTSDRWNVSSPNCLGQ